MQAIDLGLSVKWADRNLGANTPADVGDLYAWGEISPKEDYSWDNYKEKIGQGRYGPYKESHFRNSIRRLDPSRDAMTLQYGQPWRIPSSNEFRELIDNCEWTLVSESLTKGYRITGRNGNSIYLPAYGMPVFLLKYWSANRCISPQHAEILELHGKRAPELFYRSRFYGFNLRGVYEK